MFSIIIVSKYLNGWKQAYYLTQCLQVVLFDINWLKTLMISLKTDFMCVKLCYDMFNISLTILVY